MGHLETGLPFCPLHPVVGGLRELGGGRPLAKLGARVEAEASLRTRGQPGRTLALGDALGGQGPAQGRRRRGGAGGPTRRGHQPVQGRVQVHVDPAVDHLHVLRSAVDSLHHFD